MVGNEWDNGMQYAMCNAMVTIHLALTYSYVVLLMLRRAEVRSRADYQIKRPSVLVRMLFTRSHFAFWKSYSLVTGCMYGLWNDGM
jgi:hypothetical protein